MSAHNIGEPWPDDLVRVLGGTVEALGKLVDYLVDEEGVPPPSRRSLAERAIPTKRKGSNVIAFPGPKSSRRRRGGPHHDRQTLSRGRRATTGKAARGIPASAEVEHATAQPGATRDKAASDPGAARRGPGM